METNAKNKLPQPGNTLDSVGESMKDSMSESPTNNDNMLIPTADDLTNEEGELDAEAFKESYQQNLDPEARGTNRTDEPKTSTN